MTTFHLGFPSPTIEDLCTAGWGDVARLAEQGGFHCLWHSNERFYREMIVRMTVSTLATSTLGIGGAIVEPFSVHPAVTAQAIGTLNELSDGRATVALGAGGSGFPMMGIRRRRTAVAIREAYTVMKPMLAGQAVDQDGELIEAHGARLHFSPPGPSTVWIASRGDRTLEMSGQIADGVMIATYATPEPIQTALGIVRQGVARRDPALAPIRVMTRVDTCVHRDPALAAAGCRLMIAKLLWASYPDRNFVTRLGLEVPDDMEVIIGKRDYDLLPEAAELVPDEFVAAMCWAGTPERVAERVIDIARSTGIDEFGFWVLRAPGQSREEAVRMIADDVLPRVETVLADGPATIRRNRARSA